MRSHSRYAVARGFLIFWCLFIGIGAVGGAACMLIEPDGSILGMDGMLPYFQVLPFADVLFQNFTFSGIALLIVNGLSNLIAAAFLFARRKVGNVLGCLFGITLMLWICIQFVIFPANFMSTTYFIFGLIQALTGCATIIFYGQEHFPFDPADYKNIGTNPRELVVYFSRMGYAGKLACETADKSGAQLLELHTTERTEGTPGFWWCGRYGMHRWTMPIEPITADLASYDKVTICCAIWVFHAAAPVRCFCQEAAGKIKAADYILVHHMHSRFESAAAELDELLGLRRDHFRSVQCHVGKFRDV